MSQVFSHDETRGDRRRNVGRASDLLLGLAMLFAASGGAGCALAEPSVGDEPIDSVSQESGRPGFNGIPPAVLTGGLLGPASLVGSGIITPGSASLVKLCESFDGTKCILKDEWANWVSQPPQTPSDDTPTLRRHLLSALIQGSMAPEVMVLVDPEFSVPGMFGTATWWTDAPLDEDAQELMSAFIAVKVNFFGATVPVGIVGPGPGAEAPMPIEDHAFTYQEAVFAGNLFTQSPHMVACTGAQNSAGGAVDGQALRICSQPGNPCNIDGLGPCQLWCNDWAGVGIPTGEYCTVMKDNQGGMWAHSLTTYMRVMP